MARAHCAVTPFDPTTGQVMTSATVNIYNPGTVTPISATIFDKNGNTLSNPLTSDSTTGLVDFYLGVAQEVDLVVSKASFTTRTYSNVPVLDDASNNLTALLTTTGDLPYASSANTPARLGIGSTGAILTVSGGVPTWSNTISAGGLSVTGTTSTITGNSAGNAALTVKGASATSGESALVVQNSTPTTTLSVSDSGQVNIPVGPLVVGAGGLIVGGANPGAGASQISLGFSFANTGGGSTATLGTVGGSGPATAAQNTWLKLGANNSVFWIPVWA